MPLKPETDYNTKPKDGDRDKLAERMARRRKRLEKPVVPQITKLLLALELLLTAGFGIMEITRIGAPGYSPTAREVLASLLAGGLVPGVPLLALCGMQLWRIKNNRLQSGPKLYLVSGGITLGVLALLLLGWLAALLFGF